jgi:hypothetical protein
MKLVRLTNLQGAPVYIGSGWVIRPDADSKALRAEVYYSGVYQPVLESVEEIAKLVEEMGRKRQR